MGWFSPIKGHYPSLGQLDKTLPVATSNEGIVRGMVVEMTSGVNSAGEFKITSSVTASNKSLLYISLQDYKDAQAGMAGTMGLEGDTGNVIGPFTEGNITIPAVTVGVPAITGLSLNMEGEYETDQFTGLEGSPVGTPLTVTNGLFTAADASDKDSIVAYLTAPVYNRWVNNASAKLKGADARSGSVVRQGANVPVIRFCTK